MTKPNQESDSSSSAAPPSQTHARLLEASQSKSYNLTNVDPLSVAGNSPSLEDISRLKQGNKSSVLDVDTFSDRPLTCSVDSEDCNPNPKVEAQAKSLINNPVELASEIAHDFSVFDRRKDGRVTADEVEAVRSDPKASAHDKLLAEILNRSWFDEAAHNATPLTKANLKRIDTLFDPAYAAAEKKLESPYTSPTAAIKGAIDNFDALSQNGVLSWQEVIKKENLTPQQRAIGEQLDSQASYDLLTSYRTLLDHEQFKEGTWQFSKQDLEGLLQYEQKLQTADSSQLTGMALKLTGQDWLGYQKSIGNELKNDGIKAPLLLPLVLIGEIDVAIDAPSQAYSNYKGFKAEQTAAKQSQPAK
jgi:hypothetical protein